MLLGALMAGHLLAAPAAASALPASAGRGTQDSRTSVTGTASGVQGFTPGACVMAPQWKVPTAAECHRLYLELRGGALLHQHVELRRQLLLHLLLHLQLLFCLLHGLQRGINSA